MKRRVKPRRKQFPKSKFRFPKEIAVFPLPNAILFPDVDLPLYVFEERYRKMLDDVIGSSKLMAVSLFKKDWRDYCEPYPSHDVVGVGYLRAAVRNADGTSHIVLRGIGKARVIRYLKMRPYRVAEIKEIKDEAVVPGAVERLAKKLKALFVQKARFLSEKPQEEPGEWRELNEPNYLANISAFTVRADYEEKQKLLENTNLKNRLSRLVCLMEEELLPKSSLN